MKETLKALITSARWFGGKGRQFDITDVRSLRLNDSDSPRVTIDLVTLRYDDGTEELYQLPLSVYAEPQEQLAHALVGQWTEDDGRRVTIYDALHDHAATPLWLQGFAADAQVGDVRFHRVGEHELDLECRSTLLSGEQSNSSVAFGEESLMKVFRRLTPGVNPDVEVLTGLTQEDSPHVAALYGYVETTTPEGEVMQLGILQQFLRTASDGWDLALASLRDLFAEPLMTAHEAGGDFAGEAFRLGVALAEVHESLRSAFGTESWSAEELDRLAGEMTARLDAACEVVPELGELAPALRRGLVAVREVQRPVQAQRIHGDLHLGQTLRTVRGWKIIDFEGEPLKSLDERRRPDSPWRDVAGMLRSFDYAAELTRIDHVHASGDADNTDEEHAREWARRNQNAFLAGYDGASALDLDDTLLTAYAIDKAVYEAVYEARNRPAWQAIPLAALSRLAEETA